MQYSVRSSNHYWLLIVRLINYGMLRIVRPIISIVVKKMFSIQLLVENHIDIALILKRIFSYNSISTFSLHGDIKLTPLPLLSITSRYLIIIRNLCRCLLIFFELWYYFIVIELRDDFRSESKIVDANIWRVVSMDRCITVELRRATIISVIWLMRHSQIVSFFGKSTLSFKSILCSDQWWS